jgi:hypothetical protein
LLSGQGYLRVKTKEIVMSKSKKIDLREGGMKRKSKDTCKGNTVGDWLREPHLKGSPEAQRRMQQIINNDTGKLTIIFFKDRQPDPKDKKKE